MSVKITSNIDYNDYGDEGALAVARHLRDLRLLTMMNNSLGLEGVVAVASSLVNVESIVIRNNEEVMQGACLGRLPNLKELHARTYESTQRGPDWRIGLQWHSPNS